MNLQLLRRFIRDYPFQPATGVWRTVEIGYVLSRQLPQGRGLDLGCGDGLLTKIVAERAGWDNIVGIDPDAEESRLAAGLGIYRTVHTASAAAIPEPDASFDWVFSNSVLEHVDEIDGVLADVARVLRPGGEFVLTVPGPDFHSALRGPLMPWADRRAYMKVLDARLYHHRYWGEPEWTATLAPLGFTVVEGSEYLSKSEARRWETVARCTSGMLYSLFGRRKRPIEIQRTLAMRSGNVKLPRPFARVLAWIFSLRTTSQGAPYGCVFIRARRNADQESDAP